jgi:hypothetical protein
VVPRFVAALAISLLFSPRKTFMGSPGRHSVNRAGGPSYISVDVGVNLSNSTGVTVTDENGDAWKATPFKLVGTRTMVIKLKGKKSMAEKIVDSGDTGQLTVVLSNPSDTTQVPVNYVDDPNP